MKFNKKILILICATSLFWSCNDAIDIEQPGELNPGSAFNTVPNLNSNLLGLYDILDTSPEIQFNAVFTDAVAIGADNGGQGLGNGEYGFRLNAGSAAPTQNWLLYHAALNSANRIIEAGNNLIPEAGEEQDLNDILGQAYAIRAFSHFQVISYFSTDYTDDNALGGFLVNFVPSASDNLPRSTNGEIFQLIDEDLVKAKNLISFEANPTLMGKDFVTALQARVAAYRGLYSQADSFASELLGKYDLATREEYVDVFKDSSNVGIIFKLERTLGDSHDRQATTGSGFGAGWVGANFAFVDGTIDGSPYFEMGRSLFNTIDQNDVRFDVLLNETSIYDNGPTVRDTLVIGKYPGSEKALMNDLKVFRIAEMLMIKAEALADQGNFNGATNSTAALIKQLRDARFGSDQPLPVYASEEEAFGAILDERRIEFAYEGHRYKDLKRLGVRGNRSILRDPDDCSVNGACELATTDFRFTMPIPLTELNANPAVQDQQNPGYTN
ncbi:RagB/SusD family nutrient uptake outer membrane protein [Aquimarina sp. TRL1]|uniref:RagB/SusD family nutrient uptake outer membrane protein n=1 Tax=Aquimarina sp. (strain TRL1) TaxID=2736252 RepID=UPI001589078C|nr:RagB/SusD family nutrient uptake outer membrane protein [Aquimarina sp. TRL1]QKX03762.1 RagB/SusD family nutrient uptake outer membrane protein [Aquimarina sp. TRL1]